MSPVSTQVIHGVYNFRDEKVISRAKGDHYGGSLQFEFGVNKTVQPDEESVFLSLVYSGKWLYTPMQGIAYPGGMCQALRSCSIVKVDLKHS